LGPDQRTAIKARGSYDPHYEAGQMTATTKCCNVRKVLAMWVSCTGVSSAKFCFLIQMSTKLCRTLHRFAEGMLVTNGSIGGGDGRMAEAIGHS